MARKKPIKRPRIISIKFFIELSYHIVSLFYLNSFFIPCIVWLDSVLFKPLKHFLDAIESFACFASKSFSSRDAIDSFSVFLLIKLILDENLIKS